MDFDSLNNTYKINWIKELKAKVFAEMSGLKFPLMVSYNIDKIPIHLSKCHKPLYCQRLLLYNHNFSVHSYSTWNNGYILFKNRFAFSKNGSPLISFGLSSYLMKKIYYFYSRNPKSLLDSNYFIAIFHCDKFLRDIVV